jgi:RES domain-containing protein
MPLSAHLAGWTGDAYRHIPKASPFDVLDFRFAGLGADNRWNSPGQPTLYLAGDEGVLIAEWGRHFSVNRTLALQQKMVDRSVYRLHLSLDAVLDLRDDAVCRELSLEDAPLCFLDRELARAVATFIRVSTAAQGILVPSISFLDQPDRWCLVIFLDKVPDPRTIISSVTPCGLLRHG